MIIVAGASGTIGSAIAKRLVVGGRKVLLVSRTAEKIAPLASELRQPYAVTDYLDAITFQKTMCEAVQVYGQVEGIVNAAGSFLIKSISATGLDEFQSVLEANLSTAFQVVKLASHLLAKTGGSVVLFASAAAEVGMPNHEAIAAAKAGVIGLARSAAASLAHRNIRVNVVSPGLVQTESTRRIWETPATAVAARDMHPLGRLGEPDKIASLVEWLCETENDWITGQVIGIDGGLSHVLPRRRGS